MVFYLKKIKFRALVSTAIKMQIVQKKPCLLDLNFFFLHISNISQIWSPLNFQYFEGFLEIYPCFGKFFASVDLYVVPAASFLFLYVCLSNVHVFVTGDCGATKSMDYMTLFSQTTQP